MTNLVSVIIPTYNRAHIINNTIESVISQKDISIELIIIDDHSTDNTKKLISSLKRNKIKYRVNKKKKGAPGARNTGLELAEGDWIQFLDSDDIILPNKICNQIKLASPDVSIIAGDYKEVRTEKTTRIVRSDNDVWCGLIRSKLGITSANLFRRSDLLEIGGWNEKINSSQEYDLMFRLLKAGKKVIIDRSVNTNLYLSDNSVSQSTDPDRLYEIYSTRFKLRDQIRDHLVKTNQLTQHRKEVLDKYLYDQLWFNWYKHPTFFKEQMKRRSFDLPVSHRSWRALKSMARGTVELLKRR